MVWPIDAQKGRFPSKIVCGGWCGAPDLLTYSPTLHTAHRGTQPMHHIRKPGALLPATAVDPPWDIDGLLGPCRHDGDG